jgi:hypothetical protein
MKQMTVRQIAAGNVIITPELETGRVKTSVWVPRGYLINHELKIVFCLVEKNLSTSLIKTLTEDSYFEFQQLLLDYHDIIEYKAVYIFRDIVDRFFSMASHVGSFINLRWGLNLTVDDLTNVSQTLDNHMQPQVLSLVCSTNNVPHDLSNGYLKDEVFLDGYDWNLISEKILSMNTVIKKDYWMLNSTTLPDIIEHYNLDIKPEHRTTRINTASEYPCRPVCLNRSNVIDKVNELYQCDTRYFNNISFINT